MAKLNKFSGENFFQDCAKAWKKISSEELEKYQKISQRERLVYLVKKMEFQNFKRSSYKKAPSAFNLYVAEMSEEVS